MIKVVVRINNVFEKFMRLAGEQNKFTRREFILQRMTQWKHSDRPAADIFAQIEAAYRDGFIRPPP